MFPLQASAIFWLQKTERRMSSVLLHTRTHIHTHTPTHTHTHVHAFIVNSSVGATRNTNSWQQMLAANTIQSPIHWRDNATTQRHDHLRRQFSLFLQTVAFNDYNGKWQSATKSAQQRLVFAACHQGARHRIVARRMDTAGILADAAAIVAGKKSAGISVKNHWCHTCNTLWQQLANVNCCNRFTKHKNLRPCQLVWKTIWEIWRTFLPQKGGGECQCNRGYCCNFQLHLNGICHAALLWCVSLPLVHHFTVCVHVQCTTTTMHTVITPTQYSQTTTTFRHSVAMVLSDKSSPVTEDANEQERRGRFAAVTYAPEINCYEQQLLSLCCTGRFH